MLTRESYVKHNSLMLVQGNVGRVKKLGVIISAFFKEFSLGGQNREKRQNEKYEPSRFGERASLKRDFVKL